MQIIKSAGQSSQKSKNTAAVVVVVPDLMRLAVGVALLCHCALIVAARSLPTRPDSDEGDPMVAMPSGQSSQADAQEVAYQPAGSYAMGGRPAEVGFESPGQVRYVTEVEAEQYEVVQPAAQSEEASCKQRQRLNPVQDKEQQGEESAAAAQNDEPNSSPGYAGQIVYVSQNGNEADQLKDAAASWSQASDLSATILTEVPVKDMSPEVLSKLRRDFGVKVVATRERPGANLVINCEEYSGTESSICGGRQPAGASQELVYEAQPIQRVQIESGEAIPLEPRRRISSFHQIEHFVQPAGESGARLDVGEGEQVVYGGASARPSGVYESSASRDEATRDTPDGPGGAAQEASDSYGPAAQRMPAEPTGNTQEHPADFGEQQ